MPPSDPNSLKIKGGDLFLHVGPDKTPFRIHSHFLIRESAWWRRELTGDEAESSVDAPLKRGTNLTSAYPLGDVLPEDFRLFLSVFYNNAYGDYSQITTAQWMVIMRYAVKWSFKEVQSLAIRCLENQRIDIAERIVLYQRLKVSNKYLLPHYLTLVSRPEGLELDECRVLGPTNLWFLQHARDEVYAKVLSSTSATGLQDIGNTEMAKIIISVYGKTLKNIDPATLGSLVVTRGPLERPGEVVGGEGGDERDKSDTGSWEDMDDDEDEDEEWDASTIPGSFSQT